MNGKNIEPIKAKFTDIQDSNYLVVHIAFDNLTDHCSLYWEMATVDGDNYSMNDSGNVVIKGSDYTNWNGNNEYPYTFTADQLGLTIIT